MPILIPRTVTPHPFKHLAKSPLRCLPTQARHLHEIVAADSIRGQATLEQDVNEYAPPLRARRHGFKSLPVSPLLREENAKKPRKRNAQQHDALKDLQKEVATNPYGMNMIRKHRTRKTLTPPCSTSTRNSYPNLHPHACAPTISLPAPLHHNDRKTTTHRQFSDAKTESSPTSRSQG
jgi:hypothetical protein